MKKSRYTEEQIRRAHATVGRRRCHVVSWCGRLKERPNHKIVRFRDVCVGDPREVLDRDRARPDR
jgi:hypothetical protein